MLPSEVRAAAEMILLLREDHERELSADETRERLFGGMTMEEAEDKASRMICGLAEHILATVPTDGDDAITIPLLERWGGVVCGEMRSFLMPHPFGTHSLAVKIDDDIGVCVLLFAAGYWRFLRIGITSAADLRALLKLLGCKLEGG